MFSNKQSNGSYLDGFVEASVEMPPDGLNGECIVHYSGQYSGYRMRVKLVNGVREGKAVIENGNEPYMRLEYKRGSLTGGVERVKSSGSVELSGHLVGGVEDATEREERKRREREEEERRRREREEEERRRREREEEEREERRRREREEERRRREREEAERRRREREEEERRRREREEAERRRREREEEEREERRRREREEREERRRSESHRSCCSIV